MSRPDRGVRTARIQRLEESLGPVFESAHPATDSAQVTGGPQWRLNIGEIDACLPLHGLDQAGLHEIEPLKPVEMPALTGFAFGLLAQLPSQQPIIWCVSADQVGDYGQLYAFGVQRYGISPARIVFARVNHPLHLHFALEEALKTEGVAAVIGEGRRPTFTGSRRLSLLARRHNTPCLLLSGERDGERGSAALTRWQVAPVAGVEDPHDPFGPGLPTWRVALTRARGGRTLPAMEEGEALHDTPYPWRIVFDEQTLSFRPAAVFCNAAASGSAAAQRPAPTPMVGTAKRDIGESTGYYRAGGIR